MSSDRTAPQITALQITALLYPIRIVLAREWFINHVIHIYREGNACVDWPVRSAISLPLGTQIYHHPPIRLGPLLSRDICGLPCPVFVLSSFFASLFRILARLTYRIKRKG